MADLDNSSAHTALDGPEEGSSQRAAASNGVIPMPGFFVAPLRADVSPAAHPGPAEATNLGDGSVPRPWPPGFRDEAGDRREDSPGQRQGAFEISVQIQELLPPFRGQFLENRGATISMPLPVLSGSSR